jgi:hypothetical protein
MALTADEQWLAQREYDKLRDEVAHLKQCQVQLVYISLLAVGVLGTALGLRVKEPGTLKIDAISTIVAASVVLILPVFGWLIIHKSRSAFRAIGWCKVIEGFATHRVPFREIPYLGYETCYERARHTNWLMGRAGLGSPRRFFRRIIHARVFCLRRMRDYYKDLAPSDGSSGRVANHGRIGTYYRKLLLVMTALTVLGFAPIGVPAFFSEPSNGWLKAVAILALIYIAGAFYYLAAFCHWEIEEFPFSIQAWYEMFCHELKQSTSLDQDSMTVTSESIAESSQATCAVLPDRESRGGEGA